MNLDQPSSDAASPARQSLRDALRQAALELEQQPAPAALAPRAMAALSGQPGRPAVALAPRASTGLTPAGWWFRPWAWPAAATVAMVLLLSVAVTLMLPPPQHQLAGADQPELAMASGFVPVAGAQALQFGIAGSLDAPMPAWLVATEMPRERLGLLGLPFDPARAGENVRAELLMHGSGAVLAVRVVAQ